MNLLPYINRLQNLFVSAQNILIFIRSKPDLDTIAAGLALYLSLSQKGREVRIVCPDKMTVSQSHLFAVDKITDDLGQGGKNLIISFPYIEGSIEKVSYNIENNRFNLVIEPREEKQLLDRNNVEFSHSGKGSLNFDLFLGVGVSQLSGLGKFQDSLQKILQEKQMVTIDMTPSQFPFETLQIVTPGSKTISEIVALLLSKMSLPVDQDIAANLLTGIKDKTNNFREAGADTFEAAAFCLRKSEGERGMTPPQQTPPDWLKPKIFRSKSTSVLDDKDRRTIF